ncbi:hypothetical protein N8860_02740 [Alphaproteobacteria bacterium]|nr:hypothetical protein [Alphaproteobacteria bacterium]
MLLMLNVNLATSVPTERPDSKKNVDLTSYQLEQSSSATLVPYGSSAPHGIPPTHPSGANHLDLPHARIYHPKQAPSAIMSENFLAARAMMQPGFTHNAAQTNIARISNLYKEVPRFRNEIDILA